MPRPSRQIDLALLTSGMALYPQAGAAGLTVRAVAEHAGVNPAMFHYHFGSKDDFLRTLLQRMYEEMYGGMSTQAQAGGPALERLRGALFGIAVFARGQRRLLARLLTDAIHGEPVARDFLRENGPRHMGLLFGLVQQAVAERALPALPPLQQLATLMGAVVMPVVFIGGVFDALEHPLLSPTVLAAQILDDAAIRQRIDLALAGLGTLAATTLAPSPSPAPSTRPAPRGRARKKEAP